MAIRGQRFELDLDADDLVVKPLSEDVGQEDSLSTVVGDVQEHDDEDAPPLPPAFKANRTGFPEHKPRPNVSAFKLRQQAQAPDPRSFPTQLEPSDRAIRHHVGKKYGVDLDSKQRADISDENKRRIEQMSTEDIEAARAELMGTLSPAFIERLLKRANIDEDHSSNTEWPSETSGGQAAGNLPKIAERDTADPEPVDAAALPAKAASDGTVEPSIHFPTPPRPADDYVPLDIHDPAFLSSLKTHYFPDTPHDPSSLAWLQDPTDEENQDSLYNPEKDSYPTSSLRFGFNGRLIAPKESLNIDVSQGLHHHGEAPSSAGYTIPELTLLARSTMPNQRCIAYQVLGRILYRLGRGDFGKRGSDLQEGLWSLFEAERSLEIIMAEANRQSGHASAKSYATEALWLWRKGGGGDRGVLKPGQKVAK